MPDLGSNDRLGPFELLFELASGGMATIYVARQSGIAGFERLVVIKRVHSHLLKDADFRAMFEDEGRLSASIRHPNVVPVIDVGSADGELFLVLEYVESLSLKQLIGISEKRGTPLPPATVSRVLSDVLAGLHAAHEAVGIRGEPLKIVHRDVSPHNVIVAADGLSRIIDFGIAKAVAKIGQTDSKVLKGKLKYMSPEQIKRKPLDRRSDIFAAGVVLAETLTGKSVFDGDNEAEILMKILLHGEEDSPETKVPVAFKQVVAKALAPDRDERFQTALEFQEALELACPPAAPREVARLLAELDELGGGELAQRRERLLTEMKRSSGAAPASPRSQTKWLAAVGVAVLLAAAGILSANRRLPKVESEITPVKPSTEVVVLPAPTEVALPLNSALVESAPIAPVGSARLPPRMRPHPHANARPSSELHVNPYAH